MIKFCGIKWDDLRYGSVGEAGERFECKEKLYINYKNKQINCHANKLCQKLHLNNQTNAV